ncbi:MAG TPA: DUF1311 domain-containing protein [Bauldia sp.]|nr:DUF1311 domain-containing protein [Bauldia sp.]
MRHLALLALSAALAIPLSLAAPAAGRAADWDIPPADVDCPDATSNVEMATCADAAFKKADAELNAVWKEVLATIKPDGGTITDDIAAAWKADLVAAQQAWVTFKDKDCNGARSYEYWGGSGRGLAVTSCLYEYTAARVADLKARYLDR